MPWHQTPSRKKKAVVFINVTTNPYQDQLHAGFSKVCEIFKVRGIESLKYVRWTKRTVIGCLTCRSNGLMGGPWPIKPAIYSRPSAISLKVWLRETRRIMTTHQSGKHKKHLTNLTVKMTSRKQTAVCCGSCLNVYSHLVISLFNLSYLSQTLICHRGWNIILLSNWSNVITCMLSHIGALCWRHSMTFIKTHQESGGLVDPWNRWPYPL